ncbi:MAG: cupredoxin domain-containing protein [Rickettsiaceae bacterium]|nr:cupredoxin domain-containing protein [Rickettsiaceae bacterium]
MKNLYIFILVIYCVIANSYANNSENLVGPSCNEISNTEEKSKLLSLLDSTDTLLEIDLYLRDHKFSPEIIKIPSERKVRLTIHNQDPTIEEFESHDLKREKIILANSKALIILAPLKKGIYKFVGEFHEETAQGKIIVEDVVR